VTDQVPAFVRSYWKSKNGELLIGGAPVSSIVARYSTPIFLYERATLDRKYTALRRALPERFSIFYSVKANPNPALMGFFLERGCGLEIASAGEFQLAQRAGCAPKHLLLAGPGKTESELELVIANGIGEIHAESMEEVERVSTLSRKLGVRTRVALRVNPVEDVQGGAIQMGGKPSPFGVDEESLEPLLRRFVDDPQLVFQGIHLFVGTQILDHHVLMAQYRKGLDIARRAAVTLDMPIRTLDFGGGLGIPYFSGESELDLDELQASLRVLMAEIKHEACFANTNFIVEPGRFLVGEAGIYVARINDIKKSRGKTYLILDGGMNHHLAASGNLGQVIKRNFPIAVLNRFDAPPTAVFDIVGPLCTPLDMLGRGVRLPQVQIGDLVGIFQSGAYARTASPLGFLCHPTPAEVWVADGQDLLIRRSGDFESSLSDICSLRPDPLVAS
jgi:diaminopimelate decarboxylase